MDTEAIVEILERCFLSLNKTDGYMDHENVVDAINRASGNLGKIAQSIAPTGMLPWQTTDGGRVGSMVEAVIYAGDGLTKIADAISELAEAIRANGR